MSKTKPAILEIDPWNVLFKEKKIEVPSDKYKHVSPVATRVHEVVATYLDEQP